MPPWERLKPVAVVGAVVAAGLTWALAFNNGWSSSDWNQEWHNPSDVRGKSVYIGNKEVETTDEREKRLAKSKLLREEAGTVKKSILGDRRRTRGDDIIPENPPLPEGFDYNPREACQQMKMEFPERYGNVDCMSDRFDNPDPWYHGRVRGQ